MPTNSEINITYYSNHFHFSQYALTLSCTLFSILATEYLTSNNIRKNTGHVSVHW